MSWLTRCYFSTVLAFTDALNNLGMPGSQYYSCNFLQYLSMSVSSGSEPVHI